jgi:hypothetical protein
VKQFVLGEWCRVHNAKRHFSIKKKVAGVSVLFVTAKRDETVRLHEKYVQGVEEKNIDKASTVLPVTAKQLKNQNSTNNDGVCNVAKNFEHIRQIFSAAKGIIAQEVAHASAIQTLTKVWPQYFPVPPVGYSLNDLKQKSGSMLATCISVAVTAGIPTTKKPTITSGLVPITSAASSIGILTGERSRILSGSAMRALVSGAMFISLQPSLSSTFIILCPSV